MRNRCLFLAFASLLSSNQIWGLEIEEGFDDELRSGSQALLVRVSSGDIVTLDPNSTATFSFESGEAGVQVHLLSGGLQAFRLGDSRGLKVIARGAEIDFSARSGASLEIGADDLRARVKMGRVRFTTLAGRTITEDRADRLLLLSSAGVDYVLPQPPGATVGTTEGVNVDLDRAVSDADDDEQVKRPNLDRAVASQTGLKGQQSYDPAPIIETGLLSTDPATNTNSARRSLAQSRRHSPDSEAERASGETTNRVFQGAGSVAFFQTLGEKGSERPGKLSDDGDDDLIYVFNAATNEFDGVFLRLDSATDLNPIGEVELVEGFVSESVFGNASLLTVPIGAQFGSDPPSGPIEDNPTLLLRDDGMLSSNEIGVILDDGQPIQRAPFLDGRATFSLLSLGFRCDDPARCSLSSEDYFKLPLMDSDNFERPTDQTRIVHRDPDNFLLLQATSTDDSQSVIFAAGDIDAPFKDLMARVVDQYYISPGTENYESRFLLNVAPGIRAFLPNETSTSLSLSDSGLLTVTPAIQRSADGLSRNPRPFIHVDFGLDGVAGLQRSTISASIGSVSFVQDGFGGWDARLNGQSVGTYRNAASEASVAIRSPIFSTSAGGGNPELTFGGETRLGNPGFFVLENYDPDSDVDSGFFDIDDSADSNRVGGTLRLLGTPDAVRYAYLRLATGVRTSVRPLESGFGLLLGDTSDLSLVGFVAGLVEIQTSNAIEVAPVTGQVNSLTSQLTGSLVDVSITLNGTTLELGGAGRSAFIDRARYGASDGNATLLSSGFTPGVLPQESQSLHTHWGFFLGDAGVGLNGAVAHAHLVPWVAGSSLDPADVPSSGTASYEGGAIGNVTSGGELYLASGSFRNSWDFAAREGSFEMDFDGVAYAAQTFSVGDQIGFAGELSEVGPAIPTRIGGLTGRFVGPSVNSIPESVIGRFTIKGNLSSSYAAAGVFAGDRSGQ